jgi:hypothetical protein
MNGWALGGLLCIIYMLVVGGLALKKSPGLIKVIKLKLGKKISDKAVIVMSLVMAGVIGAAGIVFIVIGAIN